MVTVMSDISICISHDESDAWGILWKWKWFTRSVWESEYWREERDALAPILSLLPDLGVESILDCSCGLGYKTILFSKAGYDVEGSDASPTAIKYAPILAGEHGLNIRFFISRYDELYERCSRRYDCVWSDNFDEIDRYEYLKISAKNIYKILNRDGKFIFIAQAGEDLYSTIEREWRSRSKFVAHPLYREGSKKVIHIEVAEKTSEGIIENNIFIIEEEDSIKVEVASIMNPRIKWKCSDFKKVLTEAGFRGIDISKGGIIIGLK